MGLNGVVMMLGRIVSNYRIGETHYLMSLSIPANFINSGESSFKTAVPGQFVMLRIKGNGSLFLGRPFSIYSLHQEKGQFVIDILYSVVGHGTVAISQLRPDEEMFVLGPLGRGFDIFQDCGCIIIIAGGVGIAPLSFLAGQYREHASGRTLKMVCYAGARSSAQLVGLDRMRKLCSDVRISTDDGSQGHHGNICDLFARDMTSYDSSDSVIYSCGPPPMMKRLAQLLRNHSFPCQVSVEERMACGVGACLGCAIGTRSGYKRVCKDGPVFDIDEIDWE